MTEFSPWLARATPHLILWIGALCTLGMYSVLYRENRLYRLFEHIFLGLATGYGVALAWTDVLLPLWWKPLWNKGEWWLIFPLVVGLCYYLVYFPKLRWISRLVIGFFLGITAGRAFQVFANDTWPQIPASFKPVLPHAAIAKTAVSPAIPALSGADALNNALFMVILVCVMSYFFFSFPQKHPVLKGSAKLGRWMLMFTFGAIFGSTVMARLALLTDRIDFLLNDFGADVGGSVWGPKIMLALLIVIMAVVLTLVARKADIVEE